MKWTPETFWRSTLSEFLMAIEGHNRANRVGPEPMTREELNALVAREGAVSQSIRGKPGTITATGNPHGRNR